MNSTPKNFKNILCINFGGIGDEILFLPTLTALRCGYPEAKITLLVEPRSQSIQNLTTMVDDVLTCDVKTKSRFQAFIALLQVIRGGQFDAVLSSGGSPLVSILLFFTGISYRVGYDTGILSKLLLTQAVALNKKQYAGAMYHDLVKGFGIDELSEFPAIDVKHDSLNSMSAFLENVSGPKILIHPGVSLMSVAKNIFKGWSAQNWSSLINKLIAERCHVLLCGGPDDHSMIADLQSRIEPSAYFHIFYGKTANISDLAALMTLSDVNVVVDSAPLHMSIGLGKKTVALFGPTDEKKLVPPVDYAKVVTVQNLSCRPCLWDVRNSSCKFPVCLDISLEEVYKNVKQFIDQLNHTP